MNRPGSPYSIGRPHTWEDRRDLDGMTVAPELERCFEDPRDYEQLLNELAEFANGADAEQLREYIRAKVDFQREERALAEHERRRGA